MKHFTDAYDRNNYVISAGEVGMRCIVDKTNTAWYANATGSGASKWTPVKYGEILISLNDLREVDSSGDVGAIAANGGLLASDTTPILRGDAAEDPEVFWATGNVDPVQLQKALPADIDGAQDMYVDFDVASGSTDKFSMTVESSFDGAALVSDTADDTATKSATLHRITATIAAADVPASPGRLSLALTPAAAHATNGYTLKRIAIRYVPIA